MELDNIFAAGLRFRKDDLQSDVVTRDAGTADLLYTLGPSIVACSLSTRPDLSL